MSSALSSTLSCAFNRVRSAWPQLLPSGTCAVCASWTPGRFCQPCLTRFAAPTARCGRCAQRLAPGAQACGSCLQRPLPLDAAVAAVDYGFPWDGLVARYKFHGADDLAAPLATLLQAAVTASPQGAVDWIVPIPLSPERLRERGFNQAWELARRLACGNARHDARLLERLVDTPHQAGLQRAAREANLRGAFRVAPAARAKVQGRNIALVDDVMTSGATLAEAARCLRAAGAANVVAWVVARTPR